MPLAFELARAPDVVDVVRISAVDNDVARVNDCNELVRIMVSTSAAGIISQIARGGFSFAIKPSSDAAPLRLRLPAPSPPQDYDR